MRIYVITRVEDHPLPSLICKELEEAERCAALLTKDVGVPYKVTEKWMIM